MAPNRPKHLFLSSPQLALQANPSQEGAASHENTARTTSLIDATLVGDYVIQMMAASDDDDSTTFLWQLYSIQDVITIAASTNAEEDVTSIWTDGTKATEALSLGLSSSLSESLTLTPKAEIRCRRLWNNEYDGFESKTTSTLATGNLDQEKDLLSLLQLLQAQWVAGFQQQQQQPPPKSNHYESKDGDSSCLRIPKDRLVSREGVSGLFQEMGFLDQTAVHTTEWVEMMTGSSQIVGRLPRSLVHKFNILHRGIGAFVTKDTPIDLSSLLRAASSSSSSPVPDLYVHQRVANKRIFPSLYDMFVGGVCLEGEGSELTAQREIAEELGLSKALSTPLGRPLLNCLVCTAYNRCLVDLFQYTVDTSQESISWQKEEVAWGDFVDYQVIQASADLSLQRAASEQTWPGPYPPIQSELRGVLPTDHAANYDGNWKEWDYVPDGLLVWKAWLEWIEEERHQSQDRASETPVLSFQVEFGAQDGESETVTVELSSMKDVLSQSQELAARFNADINGIQSMLQQMWADATVVPVYEGPSVSTEGIDGDGGAEGTIELPSGLVLELRPSTIGKNAGLGLFVRKASSEMDNVLQTQGSAFCGYGPCHKITDSMAGFSTYQRQRSFEFMLNDGLESYVWHKGNLLTVGDVLQSTGATAVRSHLLVETAKEDGSLKVSLVHDSKGKPCYLVPPAERPDPKSLTIQTIGHMCNDLAGGIQGQTEGDYSDSSDRNNLLVLVPRVGVNEDGVLGPTGMPILTLAKSVRIGNVDESMEVGLRYGDMYWKNEMS